MTSPEGDKKERWPSTVSVAILLSNEPEVGTGQNSYEELVLVRKRYTGQWGPIAGGILKGEYLEDTAWRELGEETSLGKGEVDIDFSRPMLLSIPAGEKTSVGIIVEARVKRKIPPEGYEPESSEIDLVKPFTYKELAELRRNPELVFKSEYNLGVFEEWARRCRSYETPY